MTDLERLAGLGRPVEATRKWDRAFGEGTFGAAYATTKPHATSIVSTTQAALAERMASEAELAGMLQIVCDDLAHSTAYPASAGDCGFLYDAGNRAQYLEDVKRRAKEATDRQAEGGA